MGLSEDYPSLLVGVLSRVGLNVTRDASEPLLVIVAVHLLKYKGKSLLAWFGERETCLRCGWRVHWCVPYEIFVGEGVDVGLGIRKGIGGVACPFRMSEDR